MQQVAAFEFCRLPHKFPQVARGVLPLPEGFTDISRLAFVKKDGTVLPTQKEVTLRRATSGAPQTVELIAYDVFEDAELDVVVLDTPQVNDPMSVHPLLMWLLGQDLWVQIADAFGNKYRSDLSIDFRDKGETNKFVKHGPATIALETTGMLSPFESGVVASGSVADNGGGFVAILTAHPQQPSMTVDFYWHTGFGVSSPRTPSPFDFKDLRLYLPHGVSAAPTRPTLHAGQMQQDEQGHRYFPLIKALSAAQLGSSAQTPVHRAFGMTCKLFRFVVVAEGFESVGAASAASNGDGRFVDGTSPDGARFWSPYNPKTPITVEGFALPDLSHIPSVDSVVQQRILLHTQERSTGVTFSEWPNYVNGSPVGHFGYKHPLGAGYGGATGGVDIDHQEYVVEYAAGVFGTSEFMRSRLETILDRHAGFLLEASGEPWNIDAYAGPPFNFAIHPAPPYDSSGYQLWPSYSQDPFGFRVPLAHTNDVSTYCPYTQLLMAYGAIDTQHWARIKQEVKALVQFWNDPMARRLLRDLAVSVRADLFEGGTGSYTASLGSRLASVKANPRIGTALSREFGWAAEFIGLAYAAGSDADRKAFGPWLDAFVETVQLGQLDSGLFVVGRDGKELYTPPFGGQHAFCMTYQEQIGQWGLLTAARARFGEGNSTYEDVLIRLIRSADALYELGRVEGANGPFYKLSVGPLDSKDPAQYYTTREQVLAAPCEGLSTYQYPISIAIALLAERQLGRDPVVGTKLLNQYTWGASDPLAALQANQLANVENHAPLLAEAQNLESHP